MSSYARFEAGGYDLFYSRSDPDPGALMIFREADKEIVAFTPPAGEDPDAYPEWRLRYSATASVIRDRLELLDFSLADRKSVVLGNSVYIGGGPMI